MNFTSIPSYEEFKNKSVVITGANGYIGSHLKNRLINFGANITSVTRKSSQHDEVEWDNKESLSKVLRSADFIFHLAAQTSAYKSESDPVNDFNCNLGLLNQILSDTHDLEKKPVIILASTATVYGLTSSEQISENHPTSPSCIYDIHKLTAENFLTNFCKSGKSRGASLRLANVYGPGVSSSSSDRGILNLIIKKGLKGDPITVYGDGEYLRDYIFIDDVVSAFMITALHAPLEGESYNLASGESRTLIDAVKQISTIFQTLNLPSLAVSHIPEPDGLLAIERRNFRADITKLKKLNNWIPATNFENGVKETIRSLQ